MGKPPLPLHTADAIVPNGIRDHTRFIWFTRLIGTLFVMNVLDGLLTLVWVYSNKAVEANPLLDLLLGVHPVLFMGFKIVLVCLGSVLLLRFYYKALSLLALVVSFGVYCVIILYHGLIAYLAHF